MSNEITIPCPALTVYCVPAYAEGEDETYSVFAYVQYFHTAECDYMKRQNLK
jgi:hypothetical protein